MDTKAISNCRKKLNELASQHNKLTTLTACLLNEIISLKRELVEQRGGNGSSGSSGSNSSNSSNSSNQYRQQPAQDSRGSSMPQQRQQQQQQQTFQNFSELRAEDILKQLSINTSD
jgi:hypothetical protein